MSRASLFLKPVHVHARLLSSASTSSCITQLAPEDLRNAYTRLSPLAKSAYQKHAHLTALRNDGQLAAQQAITLRKLDSIATHVQSLDALNDQLVDVHSIANDPTSDNELKQLAQEEQLEIQQNADTTVAHLLTQLISSFNHDPDPVDHQSNGAVILEIRAGTGGDEAALFVTDLRAMYDKLAARHSWRTKVLSISETNIGGIRELILRLSGRDVFHTMQQEAGVHRVQRVPATETQGRVHTSTASVAVLREDVAARRKVHMRDGDVKVDVYRASGAGGQHVNKTESAVRVTHIPTGLVATSQEDRSQHRNRAIAMEALAARLAAKMAAERAAARAAERRAQLGSTAGERSDRIRTYNFPQKRVTDHRIVPSAGLLAVIPSAKNVVGEKSAPLASVMEGGPELDRLIASVKRATELQGLQALMDAAEKERKR